MIYRRAHVLPGSKNIGEAASFLVSSLLISHGARVDSIAVVEIGGSWITAYGDKIRHLRPDQDSAEGWIRAVLYKGKHKSLGASVSDSPPKANSSGFCIGEDVDAIGLRRLERVIATDGWHGVLTFIYVSDKLDSKFFSCKKNIFIEISIPRHLKPALINILLDRIEAGLTSL